MGKVTWNSGRAGRLTLCSPGGRGRLRDVGKGDGEGGRAGGGGGGGPEQFNGSLI